MLHYPSVLWHIIPMKFCSWNIICFGQKEPIKVQWKFIHFLMPFLKPQGQGLFKFYITIFVFSPLYFCSSNLVCFGQKEPIEKKSSDFWVVGWKFSKLLMSYLKPHVSFSLNLVSIFSVMRDNSYIWFRQKKPIKVQSFRLSIAHVKLQQICYLIGSCCWRYIKFQLKRYRGVMSHDTEEECKIPRKTDSLFQRWQEFGKFWPEHSKFSKFHFDCFLWCKVYNVWPKKVQRSYLSRHERIMQSLKKNWLVVGKITWGT